MKPSRLAPMKTDAFIVIGWFYPAVRYRKVSNGADLCPENLPMHRLIIACLIVCPVLALAQSPERPVPPQSDRPSAPAAEPALAVRRVILYKTGVGYFEHLG